MSVNPRQLSHLADVFANESKNGGKAVEVDTKSPSHSLNFDIASVFLGRPPRDVIADIESGSFKCSLNKERLFGQESPPPKDIPVTCEFLFWVAVIVGQENAWEKLNDMVRILAFKDRVAAQSESSYFESRKIFHLARNESASLEVAHRMEFFQNCATRPHAIVGGHFESESGSLLQCMWKSAVIGRSGLPSFQTMLYLGTQFVESPFFLAGVLGKLLLESPSQIASVPSLYDRFAR
jgi:hypothetical protein